MYDTSGVQIRHRAGDLIDQSQLVHSRVVLYIMHDISVLIPRCRYGGKGPATVINMYYPKGFQMIVGDVGAQQLGL
jgi:hypothetical protein